MTSSFQKAGSRHWGIYGTISVGLSTAGGIDLRQTVGSGQVEVMYRAGTFSAPSWPFRGTPGYNVGRNR